MVMEMAHSPWAVARFVVIPSVDSGADCMVGKAQSCDQLLHDQRLLVMQGRRTPSCSINGYLMQRYPVI